eukprot:scaffold53844_cov66-Phaeocystis_antarctica.AAC.4
MALITRRLRAQGTRRLRPGRGGPALPGAAGGRRGAGALAPPPSPNFNPITLTPVALAPPPTPHPQSTA